MEVEMEQRENSPQMTVISATASGGEATSLSSFGDVKETSTQPPTAKKKRNLPGMPDPEAEVVALSPKTLLATNRFICEICNKGFQRDQNLQLHRRGHNLPWKLKQRSSKEPRKKVYICPVEGCVHHSPARALGDLTGIKKHFCRKHGEKKWKCERCSKKYAVQSDWKAHMKTCGTREYKCDCGTLFSRRDSFITHRAFCDALAEESARAQRLVIMSKEEIANGNANVEQLVNVATVASPPPPPLTPSTTVVSPGLSVQSSELAENPVGPSPPVAPPSHQPVAPPPPPPPCVTASIACTMPTASTATHHVYANLFIPALESCNPSPLSYPNLLHATTVDPPSLSLSPPLYWSGNVGSTVSLFSTADADHFPSSFQPAMSATALLQKAAQMGATTSNPSSFLRGLGLQVSQSSTNNQDHMSHAGQWANVKMENNTMMVPCLFGSEPATLDFLGLGMSGAASSALLDSYTSGSGGGGGGQEFNLDYGGREETWEDGGGSGVQEKKPNNAPSA